MPHATDDAEQIGTTPAFDELRSNLQYAYDMVHGGQQLENLQVGAFDVTDLYRAAWVQAVAALDHWVHREIYDRALGFALNTNVPRPNGFLRLKVSVCLLDVEMLQDPEKLRKEFKEFLLAEFGYRSYQQPEKIAEGLRNVSDVGLWQEVPKSLPHDGGKHPNTKDIKETLQCIVKRRNQIAHESDLDPVTLRKREITADATHQTIDQIRRIATAISSVIGRPPLDPDSVHDTDTPQDDAHQPAIGSARLELYRQFWSRFDVIVKQKGWAPAAAPPAQNWWSLPSGIGDVAWSVSFAKFGCRSELYFGSSDAAANLARWRALESRRDELNSAFGDQLLFDALPNKKACRIETRLLGPTIEDSDEWTDIVRWMADTQQRLRSAVEATGGIPVVTNN